MKKIIKSIDDNLVLTSKSISKGLLRITSKFIKKGGTLPKSHKLFYICKKSIKQYLIVVGDPKGNLYYYYFPKQIILVGKGKEINRDSESNGEWNQISQKN